MQKREKVKQIYKKYGASVNEDAIQSILKNKPRTKQLMRLYKNEEIDSMQQILGKNQNDYYFSKQELEFVSKIDLFDPYMIKIAKEIWKAKNNPELLNLYLKILEKEGVTNVSSN